MDCSTRPPQKQPLPELSMPEAEHYARHLSMPGVGEEGQRRLKAAHLVIVGLGGLGSPLALYLAAAGVGTLSLVDPDRVEANTLQRQVTYEESVAGSYKVEATKQRLERQNSGIRVLLTPRALKKSSLADFS